MAGDGTFGTYVVIHPEKLAEIMRSQSGPVARHLIEKGERVKIRAKELVGVYRPPDAYAASHRGRRPGTLRDSIIKRFAADGASFVVLVGSHDPISLIHHEGTRAHVIVAKAKPRLVFFWPKAGRVVAFKRVNHPGTKPNRFLIRALDVIR